MVKSPQSQQNKIKRILIVLNINNSIEHEIKQSEKVRKVFCF
jgi:hypothetical protein